MEEVLRQVELEGNPYEMGCIQGELFSEEIRGLFGVVSEELGRVTQWTQCTFQKYADKYIPSCSKFSSDLMAEMRGIADAANVPLNHIVMLNSFLDVYDWRMPENYPQKMMGCTAFGLRGTVTESGKTYLGQNYDLSTAYKDFLVLLRIPISGGGTALIFSLTGVLGCAGINSHGLGVVINKLFPLDGKPGVIYPMIVRKVLSQRTLAHSLGSIIGANRASGMNYIIGDSDEVIGIETTAEDYEIFYPRRNYIAHTNHYLSKKLKTQDANRKAIKVNTHRAHTFIRYLRTQGIIENYMEAGKIGRKHLFHLERDHQDHPFGICCHSYQYCESAGVEGKTLAGMVFNPAGGEIFITSNNPCEMDYERIAIDDSRKSTFL